MKMIILYPCTFAVILTACVIISGCSSSNEPNPTPEFTKSADLYEALSSFDGFLESSALDWEVNSSYCDMNTCRQQLIAENGDLMEVTLKNYNSGSDATTAYAAMKNGLDEYSIKDAQIADAGYTWQRDTLSESGFISGPIIGVVEYQIAQGDTPGQESTDFAIILADTLIHK